MEVSPLIAKYTNRASSIPAPAPTPVPKPLPPQTPIVTSLSGKSTHLGGTGIGVMQSGLDEFDIAALNRVRESKGQAPIQMDNLKDAIKVSAAANSAYFNTPKGRDYLAKMNIDTYKQPVNAKPAVVKYTVAQPVPSMIPKQDAAKEFVTGAVDAVNTIKNTVYSPVTEFAHGVTNQALDYQGIVNPEYENKSVLNRVIDKAITGDLAGAGKMIAEKPFGFAGGIALEAGAMIVPGMAATKVIKGARIAQKVVDASKTASKAVTTKSSEAVSKIMPKKAITPAERNAAEKLIMEVEVGPSRPSFEQQLGYQQKVLDYIRPSTVDKVKSKINTVKEVVSDKLDNVRSDTYYQVAGGYNTPWYNKGEIAPIFILKGAASESGWNIGKLTVNKVKVGRKLAGDYNANDLYTGYSKKASRPASDFYNRVDVSKTDISRLRKLDSDLRSGRISEKQYHTGMSKIVYKYDNIVIGDKPAGIGGQDALLKKPISDTLIRSRSDEFYIFPKEVASKAKTVVKRQAAREPEKYNYKPLAKTMYDQGFRANDEAFLNWQGQFKGRASGVFNSVTKELSNIEKKNRVIGFGGLGTNVPMFGIPNK